MDDIAGPQNNQNHYTNAELMAMQQDAIRRVQDMHRRAQQRVQGQPDSTRTQRGTTSHSAPRSHSSSAQEQQRRQPPAPSPPAEIQQTGDETPIDKILKDLNIDKDRIILLGLIILLLNEGADRTLIIALVYLLI